MKTRLLIICGLLGGMVFHSCYKDLGNYDYREINEVMIGEAGFVDTTYNYVSFVDTLRITPEVENSIIQDLDNYEFRWILNGEDEIGHEKDLIWPVNRPQGGYTLFFRIKDKSTGVVVTRSVNVNLTTNFSTGWLVWGENENGEAQLDMLAFINNGRDTVLMKNILNGSDLPVLKKPTFLFLPTFSMGGNDVQLGSEDGTYKLDRNDLTPIEDAHLKYSFWDPSSVESCVLQNANRAMSLQVEVIDGNLYFDNDRFVNKFEKIGNPSNHYKGDYTLFKIGEKIGFDLYYRTGPIIIAYDDDNKRFVYQGAYSGAEAVGYCAPIPNLVVNDDYWTPGKDFVTMINSYSTMISNYTILKDPGASSPADYYLYPCKINSGFADASVTHNNWQPQQLTNATDIDKAEFFACSSQKTVIFYTVGSRLYGYDYSTARGKLLLDFADEDRIAEDGNLVTEVITAIWNEQYTGFSMTHPDEFYIGLNDPVKPASVAGRMVGYRVVDNPNDIVIEEIPGTSRKGLCKIVSMAYK